MTVEKQNSQAKKNSVLKITPRKTAEMKNSNRKSTFIIIYINIAMTINTYIIKAKFSSSFDFYY